MYIVSWFLHTVVGGITLRIHKTEETRNWRSTDGETTINNNSKTPMLFFYGFTSISISWVAIPDTHETKRPKTKYCITYSYYFILQKSK